MDRNVEANGAHPCRANHPNGPDEPAYLETLSHCQDGSVRRCDGCGRIHVRYGNFLVVRDREGYGLLREYVDELASMALVGAGRRAEGRLNDHLEDGEDRGPLYLLAVRKSSEAAFCFTAPEVFELRGLLSRAESLLGSAATPPDEEGWR